MGLDKKKDIIERGKILRKYISFSTMEDRVKRKFLIQYKKGEFYHIPIHLFDKTNENDKRMIEKMKNYFLESRKSPQAVPINLFDLEDKGEELILFNNLSAKEKSGIEIFLNLTYNGNIIKPIAKMIEKYLDENSEDVSSQESSKTNLIMRRLKKFNQMIFLKKYVGKGNIRLQKNSEVERIQNGVSANKGFSYRPKKASLEEFKIKYTEMIYLNFLDEKLGHDSNMELIDDIVKMTDEIGKTSMEQYVGIENEDITKLPEKSEKFEEHRKGLLKIIEALSACGCLDDLIKKENKNIADINLFLSEENALECVSKIDLINRINNFDMTKKEDVIDLIIFSRHFSNKLAHTFDDYMFTTLYFSTITQEQFLEKKESRCLEIESDLKELFNQNLEDPQIVQEIVEQLLEHDLDYQQINAQIQKLQEELLIEKNAIKKRKISEKINKKTSELGNKKARYQKMFKGLENEKKRNPQSADEKINTKIAQINTTFIKKYGNKEVYTKAVLNEFVNILDDYKKSVIKKTGLPFTECPSYFEFFDAIQAKIKKDEKTEFDDLNCERDDIVYNVAEKMKWLLENCKKDGIFCMPITIFKHLAKQYDYRECAYNIKHNDTMTLIAAMRDGYKNIYMEQTPCQADKEGVTDIFLKGSIQIFGAHFKKDDPEANHSSIQAYKRIPQEMDELFSETGDRVSVNSNIPQRRLTKNQEEEFKALAKTIIYLESGYEDLKNEHELPKLEELRKLKNNKRKRNSYNAIKVRILLGSGIDNYKKYFLEKENLHEMVSVFHDQKSDKYVEEQRIALKNIAKRITYSEVKNAKARLNKSMEENDKNMLIL